MKGRAQFYLKDELVNSYSASVALHLTLVIFIIVWLHAHVLTWLRKKITPDNC